MKRTLTRADVRQLQRLANRAKHLASEIDELVLDVKYVLGEPPQTGPTKGEAWNLVWNGVGPLGWPAFWLRLRLRYGTWVAWR